MLGNLLGELVDEGDDRSSAMQLEYVLDMDDSVARLAFENLEHDIVHKGPHVRDRALVLFPHAEEDQCRQARREGLGARVAHLGRFPILEQMLAREEVSNVVSVGHVRLGIVVHVGCPYTPDLVEIAGVPLVMRTPVALGVTGCGIHEDLFLRGFAGCCIEFLDRRVVSVVSGYPPSVPAHRDDVDVLICRPLDSLCMASSVAEGLTRRSRPTFVACSRLKDRWRSVFSCGASSFATYIVTKGQTRRMSHAILLAC